MKRWAGIIPIIILAMALAMTIQAAPARAQEPAPSFTVEITDYPSTVQPGSSYNITVRVTRPDNMALPAWSTGEVPPKWEIRIYFYDGLNCYSQGEWTQIGSSTLYTGWWDDRVQGDSWTASMSDTREFTITTQVVAYPRPAADVQGGMTDIPVGGTIKLKARLRLRGMTVSQDNTTFTYNGVTYQKGDLTVELSEAGYYQIDYDTVKSGIAVSAASGGTSLPLIPIVGALVVLLVIVAVVVLVKKHGAAEVPPPLSPPPTI